MINADNYKGLFYKEKKITKYYEGGAHFKYQDLVLALKNLQKEKNNINKTVNSVNSKNSNNSSIRKDSSNSLRTLKKNNNDSKIRFNTLDYDNNSNNRISDKINSKFKPKKKISIHLITETNKKDFATINSQSVKKIRINPIDNKNNLPIIQSSYFNNLSKKNLLNKDINNNKDVNLKYKYNLYSPIKDFELNKNYKNSKEKIYNQIMKKVMEKNKLASFEIIKNFEHKDNFIVKNFIDNVNVKEKNFVLSKKMLDLKLNPTKDRKIILTNLNH